MVIYYADLCRTGHNNPRFAIISGRVSLSGGRGAALSEGDGVGALAWAGGGVRAAYNKHFMHGVRARGAGAGSGGYVGTISRKSCT